MTEFEKQILAKLDGLDSRTREILDVAKAHSHQLEVQGASLHTIEADVNQIKGVLTGQAELALNRLKEAK